MPENPYQVLGITTSATPAEVKRAYRRKVLQCHPDAVGTGREGEFRRVQKAYEEIEAPQKGGLDAPSEPCSAPGTRWMSHLRVNRHVPQFELELDRVEARSGLTLVVPLSIEMPCPHCAGLGLLRLMCARCGGWGRLHTRIRVRIDVPPGVRDDDIVRGYGALGGAASIAVEFLVRIAGD